MTRVESDDEPVYNPVNTHKLSFGFSGERIAAYQIREIKLLNESIICFCFVQFPFYNQLSPITKPLDGHERDSG